MKKLISLYLSEENINSVRSTSNLFKISKAKLIRLAIKYAMKNIKDFCLFVKENGD